MTALAQVFKRLSRLDHVSAICGWDEAVNMPVGGGTRRGEALAELAVMRTELLQNPMLSDLFQQAEEGSGSLSDWEQASLAQMRRSWELATVLPLDLVEAQSLASTACEQAWRQMRAENDWTSFVPYLKTVVDLTRREAGLRAEKTGLSTYDALLDLYEPGGRSERITGLFDELKAFLPTLTQEVMEKQRGEAFIAPAGVFPIEKQKALGLRLMAAVGFDFDHGRLDVSHHPFCGGVPSDVRLTTRYSEEDFVESLMGVLHETGHARYEQGLPTAWADSPVGDAVGMSTHESQSLLFEMQIGRGQAFMSFMAPLAKEYLANDASDAGVWTADNLTRLYTRVKPGLIRVNADEVTYPAHVILRYEIERGLIEGSVQVEDLPELWDAKMQEFLGLSTGDDYRDGCMQDVHWPSGAIGYFPTYTLGAMSAAQLYAAMDQDLASLSDDLEKGDFAQVSDWLSENVWSHGSRYTADEILERATGEPLGVQAFESHIRARYLA